MGDAVGRDVDAWLVDAGWFAGPSDELEPSDELLAVEYLADDR